MRTAKTELKNEEKYEMDDSYCTSNRSYVILPAFPTEHKYK